MYFKIFPCAIRVISAEVVDHGNEITSGRGYFFIIFVIILVGGDFCVVVGLSSRQANILGRMVYHHPYFFRVNFTFTIHRNNNVARAIYVNKRDRTNFNVWVVDNYAYRISFCFLYSEGVFRNRFRVFRGCFVGVVGQATEGGKGEAIRELR